MTDETAAPGLPVAPTGRRTLTDILAQVVGRLLNGVLGIVVVVVVARALGAEDFGRWSTLLTIIGLAGPLTELGISQVAVSRASEEGDEGAWVGALLVVRVALAVVAATACVLAALLVGDQRQMHEAGLLLALTVLLGGLGALTAGFQLRTRNDLTVVVITTNSVVWTAGVVLVGVLGGGLVALAAVFVAAAVVSVALQSVLALRLVHVSFDAWRERARTLVRVGLPLSLGTVVALAYARLDQILVFSVVGERSAGLYGAAYRILDQAAVVPLSVITTLFPLISRAHVTDPQRVHFLLQRALEVLVAVALGALAFAIPCGGDALALLFGPEFRTAGPTLAILMGVLLVISVNFLNAPLVLTYGLQRRTLVFALIGLAFNVALNVVLIPRYGYVAAAWTTLATEVVVVVLTSRATLGALGWFPDLRVLARAALAAALTCELLALATDSGAPIGVLLAATPVLYGGLLVLLGGVRLAETLAIVRPGSRA